MTEQETLGATAGARSPSVKAQDTIDAIRLTLEAAADDRAAVRVIRELVAVAPTGDGRRIRPVRLLVAAIKRGKAELRVAG